MKNYFLVFILVLQTTILLANNTFQNSSSLNLSKAQDSTQIQKLEALAMAPNISKEKQIAYLNEAIEIAENTNNPIAKANTLFLLGRSYLSTENFDEALVVSQQSLTLYNEHNKLYESTKVYSLIGTIYVYLENLDIALTYFKKALEIRYKLGDQLQISKALMNVGNILAMQGSLDEAMEHYQKSLSINEQLNNKEDLSQLYNNLANIHFAKGEMDKVLPYRLKALTMDRLTGDKYQIALKTYNLAEYYLTIKEPENALPYILESKELAETIGEYGLINDNIQFLSMYYELINNYKKALEYQKLYATSIKENFSKELSERVGEMEVKYETEKQDKETQAITLQLEKTHNQKLNLIFLLIIGFLITSFIVYLYIKNKRNNQFLEKEVLRRTNELVNKNIELKTNSIELIKAKEKAEGSDRLKAAFLTNLSHEIRTPMNGILGFTSLLIDPDLASSDRVKYASVIQKGSDRLLTTLDNIIEASKIETRQVELNKTELVVNELVESIYEKFNDLNTNEKIKFSFSNGLPKSESILFSDKSKIQAILSHLLKNAFKFTKEGTIDFGYSKKDNYLEFYIKDTGIGVPIERKAGIFDLFIKSDIEDRDAYQGSGLGLFLAKSNVEMLGGKIWMSSEKETGASFYFTIPYQIKQPENNINTETGKVKPTLQLNELKVLIVEDDVNSDIYLTAIIKNFTKNIIHASNGEEAIKACQQHQDINLILMDLSMPVINGIDAVKKIREFNKNVYIIAQTAYTLMKDKEKAFEAGCNDYISKPTKKEDLEAKILKYMNDA